MWQGQASVQNEAGKAGRKGECIKLLCSHDLLEHKLSIHGFCGIDGDNNVGLGIELILCFYFLDWNAQVSCLPEKIKNGLSI